MPPHDAVNVRPVTFTEEIVTDRLAGSNLQPAFAGVTTQGPFESPEIVNSPEASLVVEREHAVIVAIEVPAVPETDQVVVPPSAGSVTFAVQISSLFAFRRSDHDGKKTPW